MAGGQHPLPVHDHQPGCDLAVLAASIVALVVMFAAKGTSLTGGLIVAGLVWMLFNYITSTPLAWGGMLLLFTSAAVLIRKWVPSRATKPLRGGTAWGTPGKSQDRTAPHMGGGKANDGTAHRATADELRRLLDIPGVRIFHGVSLPETKVVVDHVVVAGSHVVAIFSKYVKGTRGEWRSGYLVTDSGESNILLGDPVLQEVAAMAGASTVIGLVSLSSADGTVWVDNTRAPEGVYAGSTTWASHAARAFLLETGDVHKVNLRAVGRLVECVI